VIGLELFQKFVIGILVNDGDLDLFADRVDQGDLDVGDVNVKELNDSL